MARKHPLSNWTTLNQQIPKLSEKRIKELLKEEVNNGKRQEFVIRLHRRLCTLRASRERKALLKKITGDKK